MKLSYIFIAISIAICNGSIFPANLSYHQALKDLQTTSITPDTYIKLEKELQVIQDFVKSSGAVKVNKFFNKKAGWIETFIELRKTEIQQIREKFAKKHPEISPEEPLTTEPDKVTALKQADTTFAKIIIKTKVGELTETMLADAKQALDLFKKISTQLNEQERKEATKLLGDLDVVFYAKQMEKAYEIRLQAYNQRKAHEQTEPDAIELALKELKEEAEKESKEAKANTSQKATRSEERALARQQRVAGSSLPSPEFQVSFNDKNPSKFREFGIIGNSISPTYYGIPMLGHYADAFGYQMLTRIALIEYRYTNKTQKHEKLIPAPLKKIIESSGITPELYACIWIKPKDHTFDDYNLVYHTVLGDWTGKTYLNISPDIGIFDAQGASCKTSNPVACESIKPTEVNWHTDPASQLGAFSPNNARFVLEKASIATFWSYMAHGGRSIIVFNIIITNPDLKNKVDGIIDNNWNFDAFSLALEPIIGDRPVQTLLELAKDSVL